MPKLNVVALLLLSLTYAAPVLAEAERLSTDSNRVGKARLTYLFWDVYDAVLYAPNGKWAEDKPFALKLTYLRDLDGRDIAERSAKEMRKQGLKDEDKLAEWQSTMTAIFPDVSDGDVLTGEVNEDRHTRFFFNGEVVGNVDDPAFTRAFFGIWLSENTSEPEMREQLLGEKE